MIFFCDSGGNIFNVIPSRIYQGSAGANTIRFVGQFPSSSQVLVAYKLPNGVYTHPKYMTYVDELEELQAPNGGKYSVWESVIGATPKYDDQGVPITDAQGNQEYNLDYAVTENPGEVTVQFYVYGPMQQGGVPGARLATVSSSFTVEKGVPVILEVPPSEETAVEGLLTQILSALNSATANINDLNTWKTQASQDIEDLQSNLGDVEADITGLRDDVEAIENWQTITDENIIDLQDNVTALQDNVTALQGNINDLDELVTQIDEVTIPAINARIDLQEQIIKQSGLQYTQDITQEYQTRETANGENVLNGSTAILKTVVGNTVATSNQLNASLINNSSIEVVDDGKTITLVVTGGGAGPSNFGIGKLKDLCPYLHIGDSVYLYGDGEFVGLCNSLNTTLIPKASTSATVLTAEILDTDLYIQVSVLSASTTISNLQITKVQNAQWYPFFFGLKSAGFSGFTSTKADSTSPNGFTFSFEQMPLGKTIDFENKKFVDYGVSLTVDNLPNYGIGANQYPSAYIYSLMPDAELHALGVATMGKTSKSVFNIGDWMIGSNSPVLQWIGCFAYLGLDKDWVDKNNPTDSEKATALAALNAYLSANPVYIRYISSTMQSETPFNSAQEEAGNTYTAYLGGIETVKGNPDAEYGAENTLMQNYVLIKEV